jgi:hypothetical protein
VLCWVIAACNAPITFAGDQTGGAGGNPESSTGRFTETGGQMNSRDGALPGPIEGAAGMMGTSADASSFDTAQGGPRLGCLTDGDCVTMTLLHCDGVSGYCVQCLDDSHCSLTSTSTPHCNVARKICVSCVSSRDCGEEAPYCNSLGQCVDDNGESLGDAGNRRDGGDDRHDF